MVEKHKRSSDEILAIIDQGLADAEHVTIAEGIEAALSAGRIGVKEAVAIMEVFERKDHEQPQVWQGTD